MQEGEIHHISHERLNGWGTQGRASSARIQLWPLKAIQIQVALIYGISALYKIRSPAWQDGSAQYYILHVRDVHSGTFATGS